MKILIHKSHQGPGKCHVPSFSHLLSAPLASIFSFSSLLPLCLCCGRCSELTPFTGHGPGGISEVPGTREAAGSQRRWAPLELGSPQLNPPPTPGARTCGSARVVEEDRSLAIWPEEPASTVGSRLGPGGRGGLDLDRDGGGLGRRSRHWRGGITELSTDWVPSPFSQDRDS